MTPERGENQPNLFESQSWFKLAREPENHDPSLAPYIKKLPLDHLKKALHDSVRPRTILMTSNTIQRAIDGVVNWLTSDLPEAGIIPLLVGSQARSLKERGGVLSGHDVDVKLAWIDSSFSPMGEEEHPFAVITRKEEYWALGKQEGYDWWLIPLSGLPSTDSYELKSKLALVARTKTGSENPFSPLSLRLVWQRDARQTAPHDASFLEIGFTRDENFLLTTGPPLGEFLSHHPQDQLLAFITAQGLFLFDLRLYLRDCPDFFRLASKQISLEKLAIIARGIVFDLKERTNKTDLPSPGEVRRAITAVSGSPQEELARLGTRFLTPLKKAMNIDARRCLGKYACFPLFPNLTAFLIPQEGELEERIRAIVERIEIEKQESRVKLSNFEAFLLVVFEEVKNEIGVKDEEDHEWAAKWIRTRFLNPFGDERDLGPLVIVPVYSAADSRGTPSLAQTKWGEI